MSLSRRSQLSSGICYPLQKNLRPRGCSNLRRHHFHALHRRESSNFTFNPASHALHCAKLRSLADILTE
jgi:hypothetical protein